MSNATWGSRTTGDTRELHRQLAALRMLHRVCRDVSAARDLAVTLQAVVESVVSSLGFRAAAINLVRGEVLEVAAVAGREEIRALQGQTGPREAWEQLLASAERWGALRFLSQAAHKLPAEIPVWIPPAAPAGVPDAWHPENMLVAPLHSPTGELVGVLSVDDPEDGRVPGPLQRDLLEMFAAQAAIAIDNARLHAEVIRAMGRLEREQQALRTSEERFRQAFENAPSGMATTGLRGPDEGRLIQVNAALCAMLGRCRDQLHGRLLETLVHPDDRRLPAVQVPTGHGDVRLLHQDGRPVWVSVTSSVIPDAVAGRAFRLLHVQDIHERHQREEQLAHLASHDALTGLPNRSELHRRLDRLLGEGVPVVVLFCDLDQFKLVNDRYGHEAGDTVLVEVARRLRSRVRRRDTVARVGGEEFVVLLREMAAPDARALVRRLEDDVRRPVRYGRATMTVTASIGLSSSAPTSTADELLRTADRAMYRVKADHRATRLPD